MQLFGLQLEASSLQWSFFTYSCVWELFCLHFELLYLQFELYQLQLKLFAYSGKVLLISSSMDCKQRSSTVSKRTPTVSKKFPPYNFGANSRVVPLCLCISTAISIPATSEALMCRLMTFCGMHMHAKKSFQTVIL